MPRYTCLLWLCGQCGESNAGSLRLCPKCGRDRIERRAQVHASERAVVYQHPLTGERRTPPRADQPMPAQYAIQGFERVEIMNMTRYEKDTGVVHEASNYSAGNEVTAFREPEAKRAPSAVTESLAKEVAAAAASGPWTSNDNDNRAFNIAAPLAKQE